MEDRDSKDKNINPKQVLNEGFSGANIRDDFSNEASKLKKEFEANEVANKKFADPTKDVKDNLPEEEEDKSWNENETLRRGVDTDEKVMKTIENIDLNSDITKHRYPNSHPENHKNTGAE